MVVRSVARTPIRLPIRKAPPTMAASTLSTGNVEAAKIGALSKSQLTAFIDSHI